MPYTEEQIAEFYFTDETDARLETRVVTDMGTGIPVAVYINRDLLESSDPAVCQALEAISDLGAYSEAEGTDFSGQMKWDAENGIVCVDLEHSSDSGIDGGWNLGAYFAFYSDNWREPTYPIVYVETSEPDREGGRPDYHEACWNVLSRIVCEELERRG